jgi:peptidoglycan hydrolase FlgJ
VNFQTLPVYGPPRIRAADATVATPSNSSVATTAKEFESTFLSLLIKEMRQTLEPDGGLFPGDAGDVQGGLFDLYLSQHLADAGGFGLASVLAHQLTPSDHVAAIRVSPARPDPTLAGEPHP